MPVCCFARIVKRPRGSMEGELADVRKMFLLDALPLLTVSWALCLREQYKDKQTPCKKKKSD